MMSPEIGMLIVQAIALAVLVWYAAETYRLRRATEAQVRQATLPVLEIQEETQELTIAYWLKNIGLGIATSIVLPRVRLSDSAGNVMTCEFDPVYMLVSGARADVSPVIEVRPANENRVIEKSPQTIKDAIRLAMGHGWSFELPLYVTDIAGREYCCRLVWSYTREAFEIVGGDAPEPRVGPPEMLPTWKKKPRTVEVAIQIDSLKGFL